MADNGGYPSFKDAFIDEVVVHGGFGAYTNVLTMVGWKPITNVVYHEGLVCGKEAWVQHKGMERRRDKEIITAYGLAAAKDQEIWTMNGWVEWKNMSQNLSLLQLALKCFRIPHGYDGLATPKGVKNAPPHVAPVYDIAFFGDKTWANDEFVVSTDLGPIRAHTCRHRRVFKENPEVVRAILEGRYLQKGKTR